MPHRHEFVKQLIEYFNSAAKKNSLRLEYRASSTPANSILCSYYFPYAKSPQGRSFGLEFEYSIYQGHTPNLFGIPLDIVIHLPISPKMVLKSALASPKKPFSVFSVSVKFNPGGTLDQVIEVHDAVARIPGWQEDYSKWLHEKVRAPKEIFDYAFGLYLHQM